MYSPLYPNDILPAWFTQSWAIKSTIIQAWWASGEAGMWYYNVSNRNIYWSWIDLSSGDYAILTVPVIVDTVTICSSLNNTASITSYSGNDSNITNHSATASVYVCPVAPTKYDVSITKNVDHYYTYSGDILTYKLSRNKSWSALVKNYVVTDVLPTEVSYISSSSLWVYNSSTHTVAWTLPDLIGSTWWDLYITGKVNTNSNYKFTNTTSICENWNILCCNKNELDCTNNTWSTGNELYDLSIIKSNDRYYTKSWEIINYKLNYILSGNARTDIKVVDVLPANLWFVSADNGWSYNASEHKIVWNNLSLPKDWSGYLLVQAKVLNNNTYDFLNTWYIATNTWVNTTWTKVDCILEYRCDNNEDHVKNEVYDLNIKKYVDITWNAFFEEDLVYTLKYWMSGNARDDISIVDKLPDEVDIISSTLSWYIMMTWSNWSTGQYIMRTGISLPKDGTWVIYITVKIKPFLRFATTRWQSVEQAVRTVINNKVVVWTYNTKNYLENTWFTYTPEYNQNNNNDQVNTYLRCRKDWWLCNGNTPKTETPSPHCRNNQMVDLYPSMVQSWDIAWPCPLFVNICRDDKVISVNKSDIKLTDILWNSCPQINICRDNKMISIIKSQRLSTDEDYCKPPYEKPITMPVYIPKTGINIYDWLEATR